MDLYRDRSCRAQARSRVEVVARRRSAHRGSGREAVAGSPPSADHDEGDRIRARHACRRSSHEEEACDDGTHRDAGCTHVAAHDDRRSRLLVVLHSRVRHDSRASESGSVRVDVEFPIGADTHELYQNLLSDDLQTCDLHQRCNGQ